MASNQKMGRDNTGLAACMKPTDTGVRLALNSDAPDPTPNQNNGAATPPTNNEKTQTLARQPHASAILVARGKQSVPANPATNVIKMIGCLAAEPNCRVTTAKHGSYRQPAIMTPTKDQIR